VTYDTYFFEFVNLACRTFASFTRRFAYLWFWRVLFWQEVPPKRLVFCSGVYSPGKTYPPKTLFFALACTTPVVFSPQILFMKKWGEYFQHAIHAKKQMRRFGGMFFELRDTSKFFFIKLDCMQGL